MVRRMTTRTFPLLAPLPGLALSAALGCAAIGAAKALPPGATVFSPLTLAMLFGLTAGNAVPGLATSAAHGIDLSRGRLLRLGIVLFGLNLTFASFAAVG